ncbi:PAS domain S-box protein [Halovenus rubra]
MTSIPDDIGDSLVLNSLQEPVFVVDADGNIVFLNERLSNVTAYSPEQLENISQLAEFLDVGFLSLRDGIQEVLAGEATDRRVEITMQNLKSAQDEGTIHVEARITPLDDDGMPAGAIVVLRDINTRKQMEKTLREREQRFRTMFESHSAPMLLIEPDSGQILNANEAATVFYGYGAEKLTSMRVQEINRLSEKEVARKRERANKENRNHFEFEHLLASGDVRTVEVYTTPIEIDGKELLFSIIHDISDRKQSEHELELYREAVSQTGHSVLITDEEGIIEFVNPAFEADTGYSQEEAIGKTPAILKSNKQSQAFYADLWNTILAGDVWEAELVNRSKSGQLYYVEQTIAPITDEDGKITNFVAVQSDITERKLREKRLSDLNRILRHNLRNALTAIEGYTRTLLKEVDEPQQHKLKRILAQAETLADTSEKITTVRQSLNDRYDIDVTCNVGAVLSEQVAEFEDSYPEASIEVDAESAELDLDAATLGTLLRELIDNAITHNDRENPCVTVTVETPTRPSEPIKVHVADNGPGVPEQERTAVEVGTDDPLIHSSGIGLAHVHWLVINYGGDVEIRDNEPRGTIVTLSLPPGEQSQS